MNKRQRKKAVKKECARYGMIYDDGSSYFRGDLVDIFSTKFGARDRQSLMRALA